MNWNNVTGFVVDVVDLKNNPNAAEFVGTSCWDSAQFLTWSFNAVSIMKPISAREQNWLFLVSKSQSPINSPVEM